MSAEEELNALKEYLTSGYPRLGAPPGPFPCPNRKCYGPSEDPSKRGHIFGQFYGGGRNPGIETSFHGTCEVCGGEGTLLAAFTRSRMR